MNLGQFIDPVWAQEFFAPRPRRSPERPAESARPADPDADQQERIAARIREALAAAAYRLTLPEICARLEDLPKTKVAGYVTLLVQLRHIDYNGARRNYRYGLTERGRALL